MKKDEVYLLECFDVIDADHGGTLSLSEVEAFNNAQAAPVSASELKNVFEEVDADGSGEVDKEEFIELVEKLEEITGTDMKQMAAAFETKCYDDLFKMMADPLSDAISSQELKKMVDSVNETLELGHTRDYVKLLFDKYDADGSGIIEMDEFEAIMKAIKKTTSISTLLWAFTEYKKAARARMLRFQAFQDVADVPIRMVKKVAKDTPANAKDCTHCETCEQCKGKHAELLDRIAELEKGLERSMAVNSELEKALDEAETKAVQLGAQLIELHKAKDEALRAADVLKSAAKRKEIDHEAALKKTAADASKQQKKKGDEDWWAIRTEALSSMFEITRQALSVRTAAMRLLFDRLTLDESKTVSQQKQWVASLNAEVSRASKEILSFEVSAALNRKRIKLDHVKLMPEETSDARNFSDLSVEVTPDSPQSPFALRRGDMSARSVASRVDSPRTARADSPTSPADSPFTVTPLGLRSPTSKSARKLLGNMSPFAMFKRSKQTGASA